MLVHLVILHCFTLHTSGQRAAEVRFDARGIAGFIRFTEVGDNVQIEADLQGLRGIFGCLQGRYSLGFILCLLVQVVMYGTYMSSQWTRQWILTCSVWAPLWVRTMTLST